jgi:hypothetical protein
MLQNDDMSPDFGDETGFECWAAFEDVATDAYEEVSKVLAAERKS